MLSIYQLHLHEEILLLGLHDSKGTPIGVADNRFALGGGILAELALANRIRMEGKAGREIIVVQDDRLTGDHLADGWFDQIRRSKKPASVATWLARFTMDGELRKALTQRLWLSGLLRREERPVLFFFTRNVYPLNNPEVKRMIMARLEAAVLADTPVDPRTASLVVLLESAGLLGYVIDPALRKRRKNRLKSLASGSSVVERPDVVLLAARMRPKG